MECQAKPFKCVCGQEILLWGGMVICGGCGNVYMIMVGKKPECGKPSDDDELFT
jgi:hypothetical protein